MQSIQLSSVAAWPINAETVVLVSTRSQLTAGPSLIEVKKTNTIPCPLKRSGDVAQNSCSGLIL
jgi:hypothetical protein